MNEHISLLLEPGHLPVVSATALMLRALRLSGVMGTLWDVRVVLICHSCFTLMLRRSIELTYMDVARVVFSLLFLNGS